MYVVKRAFSSMKYHYKNVLLLFAIFSAAFLLILAGIVMLQGAGRSAETLRTQYHATVGIYDFATRSYDVHDQNLISQKTVARLEKHPLVEECRPFVYSSVRSSDELRAWVQVEQAETYGDNTPLRVIGTAQVEEAPEFATGNHYLLEGEMFSPGRDAGLLMSIDLAELNGLQVGDQVPLLAYYMSDGGENVTATLVGIYGIETYQPHSQAPYFNSENLLYVTTDVAETLNGPESNVYSVSCVIGDPEQATSFVEDVQNMGVTEGENLRFIIDDGQYRAVRNAIEATTRIACAMLVAAIAVGCAVLILLVCLSLKGRDFEIGVLLSLGETRVMVSLQLFLECLVPVLLAATGAVCCSPLLERGVVELLGKQLAESIQVTGLAVAGMYITAILLILVASIPTFSKVFRYTPKKIFLAGE